MADAVANAVFARVKQLIDEYDARNTTRHNETMQNMAELKVLLGTLQGAIDGAKKTVKAPKAEGAAAEPATPRKAFPTQQNWWVAKYKASPDDFKHLITPAIQAVIDAEQKKIAESPRKTKTDVVGKTANAIRNWHKEQKPIANEWAAIVKHFEDESAAAKATPAPPAEPEPVTPV
jgi:hypothetical protein